MVSALVLLAVAPSAAADLPAHHPQITEVLFNVPTGDAGDASRDGERHAAGDEFIEIGNPSKDPINLKGYVLFSRRSSFGGSATGGVRFVFPDVELPGYAVCIVFNGCDARWEGPVGDDERPPDTGHPDFSGAMVFSMRNTSERRALANNGDWIVLSAPDGTPIDCVMWGDPDPPPPPDTLRVQKVDANPKGSVQRLTPTGELIPHRQINGESFSPGMIPKNSNLTKPAKKRK